MRNPTVEVFWMDTAGGEPGDGAWFWIETDEAGEGIDESVGPFISAVEAGASARAFIVKFSTEQHS